MTRMLLPLVVGGLAGFCLRSMMARQGLDSDSAADRAEPGGTEDAAADDAATYVRPAGTKEMADPPRDWDKVDEMADESFPASDPPGTY